jgi:hypothetical protein
MISSYWHIVYERDKLCDVFDKLKPISHLLNLVIIDDIFTGKRRQKVISDFVTVIIRTSIEFSISNYVMKNICVFIFNGADVLKSISITK